MMYRIVAIRTSLLILADSKFENNALSIYLLFLIRLKETDVIPK